MKFYNLRKRKAFNTESYKTVVKSGRKFAVAKDDDGTECWRIMGKN